MAIPYAISSFRTSRLAGTESADQEKSLRETMVIFQE